MASKRKDQICALLKGIETGDAAAVAVVNPDKYIQHNPQTREGGEGLAALFKRLSKSSPRVNIVRVFEDGDYVFAHTEYDFASSKIGFEVFRFEDDLAVEHWDNIQPRQGPNPSGHTMTDGPTEATDLDNTEANRKIVRSFVDDILINGQLNILERYIDDECYTEHNPRIADGLSALHSALVDPASNDGITIEYDRIHRLLAEGSFVLCVGEGSLNGVHSAFYDLFHVADSKLVEHWDTSEAIPPRTEWKNDNGKF
ncbi:MAG: nuclear transport factor 2 family protein [Gammaproteobacteria bacterium]|nr:nuclear transport factor 2 family protein [Gammaproteobacteria bacterium]